MSDQPTTEPVRRKGHCPKCGKRSWADVRGEFLKRDDDGQVWSATTYRILQCRGCDQPYFQEAFIFSEDEDHDVDPATGEPFSFIPETETHWPPPGSRPMPIWLPQLRAVDKVLDRLADELYVALNADLRVLAAIACRTVFDRASEILGVPQEFNFAQKLDALTANGDIGEIHRQALDVLTDAGSAAAHRGWIPSERELWGFVEILESFLHQSLVVARMAGELRSGVPPRQRPRPPDTAAEDAAPKVPD